MAVFSRYAKVLEADGSPMTVRTALGLINQALDEILAEQEGDFDADTRFAVTLVRAARVRRGAVRSRPTTLATAQGHVSVDGMVARRHP